MNSGIQNIETFDDYYDVYGFSGSVHRLKKSSEEVTNTTSELLGALQAAYHNKVKISSIEETQNELT